MPTVEEQMQTELKTQQIYNFSNSFQRLSLEALSITSNLINARYSIIVNPIVENGKGQLGIPSSKEIYNTYNSFLPTLLTYLFDLLVNIAWKLQGESFQPQLVIYTYNSYLMLFAIHDKYINGFKQYTAIYKFLVNKMYPLFIQLPEFYAYSWNT